MACSYSEYLVQKGLLKSGHLLSAPFANSTGSRVGKLVVYSNLLGLPLFSTQLYGILELILVENFNCKWFDIFWKRVVYTDKLFRTLSTKSCSFEGLFEKRTNKTCPPSQCEFTYLFRLECGFCLPCKKDWIPFYCSWSLSGRSRPQHCLWHVYWWVSWWNRNIAHQLGSPTRHRQRCNRTWKENKQTKQRFSRRKLYRNQTIENAVF